MCVGGIVVKFSILVIIQSNSYGRSYQEGSEPCKISVVYGFLMHVLLMIICLSVDVKRWKSILILSCY